MEIYALVGPSGTGKSHRAQKLLFEYNIEILVDDGLIIQGNNIVSGISAKKQKTKLGAIKTAIFNNPQHRQSAAETIKSIAPQKVLILSTSEDMARLIAQRLQLPAPQKYISIYDIATEKEVEKALYVRNTLGRHVIPAPTFEVEKNWPEIITEPLHMLLSDNNNSEQNKLIEQSVTQPTFTQHGHLSISARAIEDIVRITLSFNRDISEVLETKVDRHVIGISLTVSIKAVYNTKMHVTAFQAQKSLQNAFDSLTNLPVEKFNIIVKKVSLPYDSA